jgi:mono/diheme cytochrome c family protein
VRLKNAMRATMILCGALAVTASMALRSGRAEQTGKASKANLADGKLIYDQQCEACHYSASSEKKIGPGLAGLMKRVKFKNGMAANTNNLRHIIERGGKDMPGFRDSLSTKQIGDLIAYVKTL